MLLFLLACVADPPPTDTTDQADPLPTYSCAGDVPEGQVSFPGDEQP